MFVTKIVLYFILFFLPVLSSSNSKSSEVLSLKSKTRNRNLSTSSVACSRTTLVTTITFQKPFFGIVYAKGYSSECQVDGNGTLVIKFQSAVHKCGIKITDEKGLYQFELHLYLQYDRHIQQSIDERVLVKCAPQEILLSGSMGRKNDPILNSGNIKNLLGDSRIQVRPIDSHHFAEATFDSIECWMDILKGRMPYLKTIDSYVNIGEDITVLVKIKKMLGTDTRLSRCFAHDRTQTTRFDLTNEEGCTLDENIMPNFKEFKNDAANSKIFYTTFPAFKFPDRSNLHIQCIVVLCNVTCPKFDCEGNNTATAFKRVTRSSEDKKSRRYSTIVRLKQPHRNEWTSVNPAGNNTIQEKVFSKIGVSNVVDVSDETNNKYNTQDSLENLFENDKCGLSSSIITIIILLLCLIFIIIMVAICLGVRVSSLRRRLSSFESITSNYSGNRRAHLHPYYRGEMHNFNYGRMVDLTLSK